MRLAVSGNTVHVTLSARNVLALQHKLEMPGSRRTIWKVADGVKLVVHVEPDDDHYGDETPGAMHSETEAFIKVQP